MMAREAEVTYERLEGDAYGVGYSSRRRAVEAELRYRALQTPPKVAVNDTPNEHSGFRDLLSSRDQGPHPYGMSD